MFQSRSSTSIAMATYNGAKYLPEQLASLAAQSQPPLELVVTDDGSTDATLDILTEFISIAPFHVRVLPNAQRLGFRGNFMKAIAACEGDVIACCDQDDVWESNKLELVAKAFTDDEIKFVFHAAWLIDGNGNRVAPANLLALPDRSAPLSFFPLLGVMGFAMAFRRDLMDYEQFWPMSVDHLSPANRMAHDQWFFFLASVLGDIRYLDERLVNYRQHGSNTYGIKPPTLRSTIAYRLRNHGHTHHDFSVSAAVRADLLSSMLIEKKDLTAVQRQRIGASVEFYQDLAAKLALRSQIYLGRSLKTRLLAFRMLRETGGYADNPLLNIGRKAAVKDVLLGLVFRPLMTDPIQQNPIS